MIHQPLAQVLEVFSRDRTCFYLDFSAKDEQEKSWKTSTTRVRVLERKNPLAIFFEFWQPHRFVGREENRWGDVEEKEAGDHYLRRNCSTMI